MRKVMVGLILLLGLALLLAVLLPRAAQPSAPATATQAAGCGILAPGQGLSLAEMEAIAKAETQFNAVPAFIIPTVTPEQRLPGIGCGSTP